MVFNIQCYLWPFVRFMSCWIEVGKLICFSILIYVSSHICFKVLGKGTAHFNCFIMSHCFPLSHSSLSSFLKRGQARNMTSFSHLPVIQHSSQFITSCSNSSGWVTIHFSGNFCVFGSWISSNVHIYHNINLPLNRYQWYVHM